MAGGQLKMAGVAQDIWKIVFGGIESF